MTPTEQDIFDLKTGKLSAEQFDAKYGAGASQTYSTVEEQPVEKAPESRITEIPEQIAGAAVDVPRDTQGVLSFLKLLH